MKVFLSFSLCFNVLFIRIKRFMRSDFHLPGGWSFFIIIFRGGSEFSSTICRPSQTWGTHSRTRRVSQPSQAGSQARVNKSLPKPGLRRQEEQTHTQTRQSQTYGSNRSQRKKSTHETFTTEDIRGRRTPSSSFRCFSSQETKNVLMQELLFMYKKN